MTNRETLLAVRAIVADGEDRGNGAGCLEDGLCRTLFGMKWHSFDLPAGTFDRLRAHPAYRLLLKEARKRWGPLSYLWVYNDNVSKTKRLALIDRVIDSL